jgi:hypothetical protein
MFEPGQRVICVGRGSWTSFSGLSHIGPSYMEECIVREFYPKGTELFDVSIPADVVMLTAWVGYYYDAKFFRPIPKIDTLEKLLTALPKELEDVE